MIPKRFFDIILSAVGLLILSPLLVCIAWFIHREDGGPVFYRGKRVGLQGKSFRIFKFRTMVVNADRLGGSCTANDDPRITPIGQWLRKHKLDEIPQLINVFRGEMSLTGPRPEVKYYTDLFTPEEKTILSVRPGITDWASIWNSDEGGALSMANDPDKAYLELIRPTKLKLQLRYVRDQSFYIDIKIIFLTLCALAMPRSRVMIETRRMLGSWQ